MVDMRLRDRRMLAESYHPKRDYMNTSPTIGVLLAAGAILLPSCETERVNERPIGIYPTENVYPSGAMGAQGIQFAQQNRLLALLAPMHRDVITKH